MLSRRDILKTIGGIIGVGVVGKVAEVQAAPIEVPPVVQASQTAIWYTLGSATSFNTGPASALSGTVMWTPSRTGDPFPLPYVLGPVEWTLDLGGDE